LCKTESFGKANFENIINQKQIFTSVPNWFELDLLDNKMRINLIKNDWHSAWINYSEIGFANINSNYNGNKINLGYFFLESLFNKCPLTNPLNRENSFASVYQSNKNSSEIKKFNLPENTLIMFLNANERVFYEFKISQLSTQSIIIPEWIIDPLVNVRNDYDLF
jgi:hypothetical protein